MNNNKQVGAEILRQLGGRRFIAMTGARNFATDGTNCIFKIPRTNSINCVKIKLNAWDTYDLEFILIHGEKVTIKKSFEGIYNDQLQEIFTKTTGLYTSL